MPLVSGQYLCCLFVSMKSPWLGETVPVADGSGDCVYGFVSRVHLTKPDALDHQLSLLLHKAINPACCLKYNKLDWMEF